MSDGLTVLVIAAHGGDEVLGCGGVIARHADAGDEAHVLLLAEGGTARDAERDARVRKAEVAAMQVAAGEAAAILGARPPSFGGLPDNRMDTLPLLFVIKEIESAIESLGPAVVYTPHAGNLNLDHG